MQNDGTRFGLTRPFRRDGRSDFLAAGGETALRSAIGQILGTIADGESTPGELPWRTDFGSRLHLLRHQRNDAVLQELSRVHVLDALNQWEPRVRVVAVRAHDRHRDQDALSVLIHYQVSPPGAGAALFHRIDQHIFV